MREIKFLRSLVNGNSILMRPVCQIPQAFRDFGKSEEIRASLKKLNENES